MATSWCSKFAFFCSHFTKRDFALLLWLPLQLEQRAAAAQLQQQQQQQSCHLTIITTIMSVTYMFCVILVAYILLLMCFLFFWLLFLLHFRSSSLIRLTKRRNEFENQRPYELDESCAMFASRGGSRSGNEHFDTQRKTMLYIHGFAEESKHESVRAIVDAYLQRSDYNILVLDWADLAGANYLIDAVPNAKQVTKTFSILSSFETWNLALLRRTSFCFEWTLVSVLW